MVKALGQCGLLGCKCALQYVILARYVQLRVAKPINCAKFSSIAICGELLHEVGCKTRRLNRWVKVTAACWLKSYIIPYLLRVLQLLWGQCLQPG